MNETTGAEQLTAVYHGACRYARTRVSTVAASVLLALITALGPQAYGSAFAHTSSVEAHHGSGPSHEQAPQATLGGGPTRQASDIGVVAYDDFSTTPRLLTDHGGGEYIATRSSGETGYLMGGRPTYTGLIVSYLRGRYDDAQVGVTVRVIDDVAEGRGIMIGCREEAPNNQYRFVFLPAFRSGGGTYAVGILEKWSQGVRTELDARGIVHWSDGPWESHRVSMKCDGSQIEGFVNGLLVATAVDDEFTTGRWWVGARKNSTSPGQMEWLLKDLQVIGRF